MKSKFFVAGYLAWPVFALMVSPPPCLANDSFAFSVPFVTQSPGPNFSSEVRLSDSYSMPVRGNAAVNRSSVFTESGLAFDQTDGLIAQFNASQYTFSNLSSKGPAGPIFIPRSLSAISGTLDYWHALASEWTVSVGVTEGVFANSDLFGAGRAVTISHATLHYQLSDRFHITLTGFTTPNGNRGTGWEYSFAANIYWKFADRWWLSFGYPREVISYELTRKVYLYAGLVRDGGIFKVDFIPGYPNTRNVFLNYRETDIRSGIRWKVAKGWSIDLSINMPIDQGFRY